MRSDAVWRRLWKCLQKRTPNSYSEIQNKGQIGTEEQHLDKASDCRNFS